MLIARDFLGDDDFVMYLGDNMLEQGLTEFVNEFEGARKANGGKKSFVEDTVLERMASVTDAEVMSTFEEMGLHDKVLVALRGMGAEKPKLLASRRARTRVRRRAAPAIRCRVRASW